MRTRKFTLKLGTAALAYATLALAGNPAFSAEYWLKADSVTITMPDRMVVMWGYASCNAGFATCGSATVPGPALTVPPGDATLTVHLLNGLTAPTSLVINGLIKAPTNPMVPVWTDGTSGPRGADLTKRVRSFDAEAEPNNGTQADYTWGSASNPVKPGTYLYQSGTHPQVQVQMGLYGAAIKNAVDAVAGPPAVRAQAYAGAAYEYDNQALLLYSEIDPALHDAVISGDYGTASGPTSTIDYAPKYFLINGQPFPSGAPVIAPAGNPGRTLLRLLNAGLTTHVPMIQGTSWTVVAEDGKPYPFSRDQYTALLPAAKTVDVLLTPDIGGAVYPLVDRRLSLSNNGVPEGGMLAFLQYAALGDAGAAGTADGNLAPIAVDDTYNSVVGVTLSIGAPAGVLFNDDNTDGVPLPIKAVAAAGQPTTGGGKYTLNTNGSFMYEPLAFAGLADTFTYRVTDGKALSAPATVTINLATPTAPAPTPLDNFDRADTVAGITGLGTDWAQTAATGAAPNLRISGNLAIASATDLGGLAIWNTPSFGPTQGASFTAGGPLASKAYLVLKATGPDPKAPVNYVRVGCDGGQVVVSTMMGGSNTAAYVKQASFGACVIGNPLTAVVDAKGLVTVFVSGAFAGGVQLPDVAAWKGGGRIGIQLTTVGATANDFGGGTLP